MFISPFWCLFSHTLRGRGVGILYWLNGTNLWNKCIWYIYIEEKRTFCFTFQYLPSPFSTVQSTLHKPSEDLYLELHHRSRMTIMKNCCWVHLAKLKKTWPTKMAQRHAESVFLMCNPSEPCVISSFVLHCACCRKELLLYMFVI